MGGRELMEQKILTGNLLVSTQMANLGFEKAWNKIGGILYRTDVGDKYVHEAIKKKKAILGGEQSGHILSKINNFSGDGILTCLLYTSPSPRDTMSSRMPSSA